MELKISHQVKIARALRHFNARVKSINQTYESNVKHHQETRDKNLASAYEDYERVVQIIAAQEALVKAKQEAKDKTKLKELERQQRYQVLAQLRREKLNAELKAKITSKLPQSYEELMK